MDTVEQFIELKSSIKADSEKLLALETVIFNEHRDDPRIKIVTGRKTITINADTYDNLNSIGIATTITEKRNKKLKEFDVEVQESILSNPENYTEKVSKESIRIVKI